MLVLRPEREANTAMCTVQTFLATWGRGAVHTTACSHCHGNRLRGHPSRCCPFPCRRCRNARYCLTQVCSACTLCVCGVKAQRHCCKPCAGAAEEMQPTQPQSQGGTCCGKSLHVSFAGTMLDSAACDGAAFILSDLRQHGMAPAAVHMLPSGSTCILRSAASGSRTIIHHHNIEELSHTSFQHSVAPLLRHGTGL